jgi:ribosomal protein S18 acetylase RimI-like enzyme
MTRKRAAKAVKPALPAVKVSRVRTLAAADLDAVSALLDAVGMRRRKRASLRKAIAGSAAVLVARAGDRLVGFGRLISDGAYYGSLWDVAVAPDLQGEGIGRTLVEELIAIAERDKLYMIGLFTASHNFGFYRHHGFAAQSDVHAMIRTRR